MSRQPKYVHSSSRPASFKALTTSHRKRSRKPVGLEPPLDLGAAAAGLMRAFSDRFGLEHVDHVWVGPQHIGASYSDGSSAGLTEWRSERGTRCGVIPAAPPSSRGKTDNSYYDEERDRLQEFTGASLDRLERTDNEPKSTSGAIRNAG
jgi:hypothetical protein